MLEMLPRHPGEIATLLLRLPLARHRVGPPPMPRTFLHGATRVELRV